MVGSLCGNPLVCGGLRLFWYCRFVFADISLSAGVENNHLLYLIACAVFGVGNQEL